MLCPPNSFGDGIWRPLLTIDQRAHTTRWVVKIKRAFIFISGNRFNKLICTLCFKSSDTGSTRGLFHTSSISATPTSLYIHPLSMWHTKMANDWGGKKAVECKVLRSKSDEKIREKKKGNTTVDEMLLVCNSWRDTVTRLGWPVFTLTGQCNLRSLFPTGQCF